MQHKIDVEVQPAPVWCNLHIEIDRFLVLGLRPRGLEDTSFTRGPSPFPSSVYMHLLFPQDVASVSDPFPHPQIH
jgi:hypothetical protein